MHEKICQWDTRNWFTATCFFSWASHSPPPFLSLSPPASLLNCDCCCYSLDILWEQVPPVCFEVSLRVVGARMDEQIGAQQQLRPGCFVLLQLWLIEKWTSLSTQSNYADKQPLKILTTNCFNATQKKRSRTKKKRKRQTKPIKPMKAIKRAVRRLKRLSQPTHLNLTDCRTG